MAYRFAPIIASKRAILGRRRYPWLLLIVCVLPEAGHPAPVDHPIEPEPAASETSGLPKPRFASRIPGWNPDVDTIDGIEASTPATLVLAVVRRGTQDTRFILVDRSTGRVSSVYRSEQARRNGRSVWVNWRSIGGGETSGDPFLFQRRLSPGPPSGAPDVPDRYEIHAVNVRGGQLKWKYPTAASSGTIRALAPAIGGLLPMGSGTPDRKIQFWDARTGTTVAPSTPSGKVAFERAVRANGSPLLQLAGGTLYRLDTARSVPFPSGIASLMEGAVAACGVTRSRALWIAAGDDGYLGHSAWPNQLLVTDAEGRMRWRFPEKPLYPGYETAESDAELNEKMKNYRSVQRVVVARSFGKSEPIALVSAGGWVDDRVYLCALRTDDGKKLWELAAPSPGIVALDDATQSFYILRADARLSRTQLEYRSIVTGVLRKTWPLPGTPAGWMGVVGDDLLTVGHDGILRAYSCKKLRTIKGAHPAIHGSKGIATSSLRGSAGRPHLLIGCTVRDPRDRSSRSIAAHPTRLSGSGILLTSARQPLTPNHVAKRAYPAETSQYLMKRTESNS